MYVYFTCFVNKIEIQAIFFIFNTNPRFPPYLLYVRCKSGVTFIRRSFRDGTYRLCEQRRFRRACVFAHTSSESRGTFRQKTRSLTPLNGWTCAVEICHDGMLEDKIRLTGLICPVEMLDLPHPLIIYLLFPADMKKTYL